jgi:hypothetical protein
MLRAFFLAIGLTAFILGLECLVIDKAVLQPSRDNSASAVAQQIAPAVREVTPPEWAPWSLLSGGAVVILYSFTLPAKMRG